MRSAKCGGDAELSSRRVQNLETQIIIHYLLLTLTRRMTNEEYLNFVHQT
jgi:hypothetical protein